MDAQYTALDFLLDGEVTCNSSMLAKNMTDKRTKLAMFDVNAELFSHLPS